jgi:hypothetical protein
VTDSWADRLRPLDCLGFLRDACCPHYDGEEDRRPSVHELLAEGQLRPVLALDDGAAAHFVGAKLHRIVTWRPSAHGYLVRHHRGQVVETELPSVALGEHRPR